MTKSLLTAKLIKDGQSFVGAKTHYGSKLQTYDDGFGPLWVYRVPIATMGIVRAQTWEDAYSILEDEFFPDATETHEEFVKEYGEDYTEDRCWNEAYGFRPNGRRTVEGEMSHIYQKDLNGDYLDLLTPELVAELELTLEIEDEDNN